MNPGAVLVCLLAAGTGVGIWCWSLSQKNAPPGTVRPPDAVTTVAPRSNAEPDTLKAAEVIRKNYLADQPRLREMEKENRALRKELAKVLGAEVAPDPANAGPEGTPGEAALAEDTGPITTMEGVAAIRKTATAQEDRMQEFMRDNSRLRKQIEDEMVARQPPPLPGEVASRVAAARELAFRQVPAFEGLPTEEIIRRIQAKVTAAVKPEVADARVRASLAMGFVGEPFDYLAALTGTLALKPGGVEEKGVFYYEADASLTRSDSRAAFATALMPVLLAQNFPPAALPLLETDNDDEARALLAMVLGDSSLTRLRLTLAEQVPGGYDRGQAPANPQPSANVPQYLVDLWKWAESAGNLFVQTLHQKGGFAEVNKGWAHPPRSTAEILHQDTLYNMEKPFTPVKVTFPDLTVNGETPFFTNVAGEVASYWMVRTFADVDYASTATEGWRGDRYAVWRGPSEHGDHVLWRSEWATPGDAREFFDAIRRGLMERFEIPWQKEYDAIPNEFRVDDPHRVIHLSLRGTSVVLINASDPAFAAVMDEKFK